MKRELTVYLQIGQKDSSYCATPRLVKASTRANVKTEPDTVSVVKLRLILPESAYIADRPVQTVTVEIDESKVALVEVTQEPA